MAMDRERWTEVQQGEVDYHLAKDAGSIRRYTLPYWRALIERLPEEIRFDDDTRVLDLGCGGCGILLGLERGRLIGVDPLMDRYLKKFPFLAERGDIEWVSGAAEEVRFDEPFDVVFCINALDHVYDPGRVVRNIAESLRPGGHCVVTMNSHNTRLFRAYYAWFYRLIDSHHPYQLTVQGVKELFGRFSPVAIEPVDDLWLRFAEDYYRNVLDRPLEDRRKWARAALNPFKWPMGFTKFLLDMPPHPKRPGQRSIYSNYLYVFRKEVSGASGSSGR